MSRESQNDELRSGSPSRSSLAAPRFVPAGAVDAAEGRRPYAGKRRAPSIHFGGHERMALVAWFAAALVVASSHAAAASDVEHAALVQAVQQVADSVVQIRPIGGLDQVEGRQLTAGPTSGLVVSADGYIVSSAFGFAQRPSSILVRLPSGKQSAAQLVGRDLNRMLVLLKVDVDEPLAQVEATPLAEVRTGYAAAAVGRTFRDDQVNVTFGVISQLGRMHNRALQTDAAASAANYGGPLVDLYGRVLGIVVPMSPQQSAPGEVNEVAGVEFYDSGIGFAIPLETIRETLPRWIAEGELRRGVLGIGMAPGNPHATPPTITAVWPGSPAAAADWKVGDRIVEVEGKPVATQTQLRFQIVPRYAGDELRVALLRPRIADSTDKKRGEERSTDVDADSLEEAQLDRIETRITLAAQLASYHHPFLGIVPNRDKAPDGALGVRVRAVWPGSPASTAGIEPGDRLTSLDGVEFKGIDEFLPALRGKNVGDQVAIQLERGEVSQRVETTLAILPNEIIPRDALLPNVDKTAQPEPDVEWENGEIKLPDLPQTALYFAPQGDGPPLGLLVWLGTSDEKEVQQTADAWRQACRARRYALLLFQSSDRRPDAAWSMDDLQALGRLLPLAIRKLSIDARRVAIGGQRQGGQAAFDFAFKARRLVSGVVAVAAPLPRTLQIPENTPSSRLQILAVAEGDSPFSLLIRNDVVQLQDAGYPTVMISADASPQGVVLHRDAGALAETARWLDTLDAL